jgi:TetR/AcrR family transcriptional regulator
MATTVSREAGEQDASTRERLLDVALKAFSELGYDGASTRIIAARAGVNQGLIPYYFATKEALWREAVDRAFAELGTVFADAFRGDIGDLERVELLIRRLVHFVARRPEFTRLMTEEGKRDGPRMQWIVDRHVRPMYEATRDLTRRTPWAKRLPDELAPPLLYYIMIGAATQMFHQAPEFRRLSGLDPGDEAVIEAHADALVAIFLHGGEGERP